MKNYWHRLATFFEDGDLTPFAVLVSVAHYGPVLVAHGENVIVAWAVGALIDLLHYRTVRRLFQVKEHRAMIGYALIALLTTFMAAGYHLRFYAGDWLLALPIPLGIAVLAQHAASKPVDGRLALVKLFRNRVKAVVRIARRYQAQMVQIEMERDTAGERLESALQELESERKRRESAEAALAESEAIRKTFAKLGTYGRDIVMLVGGNGISQKEIATRHGVSEAEVSRLKVKLNGGNGNQ